MCNKVSNKLIFSNSSVNLICYHYWLINNNRIFADMTAFLNEMRCNNEIIINPEMVLKRFSYILHKRIYITQ